MSINFIKINLIVVFFLIALAGLLSSIYFIWLTAFGVGWGGGDITFFELFWMWKGLILIFVYSAIVILGLIKRKKTGVIFGYATSIGVLLYFLIDFIFYNSNSEIKFQLGDFLWSLVYVGIPILLIYGLNEIKKVSRKFELSDYIILGVLTASLFLSLFFMFRP